MNLLAFLNDKKNRFNTYTQNKTNIQILYLLHILYQKNVSMENLPIRKVQCVDVRVYK